jgi:hypothetical protein
MRKLFHVILLLIFTSFSSLAQDFEDPVSIEDLRMQSYSGDSTASAVVLKEFGTSSLKDFDNYNLVFKYHVRIKIFNSKGFNQGNVEIPVYKGSTQLFEQVSDISAVTFFLDEAGTKQEIALDRKKIYRENKNDHWDILKFALPNLKDGCIIEYSYKIESPYFFNFRKWEFQSDIPKVSSEYVARIPAVYNYNVLLVGPLKLSKSTGVVQRDCFISGGTKADCSVMTYAMRDIPAFVEEDHMTAAVNFKSAIKFELIDYTDYKGIKRKVTREWRDVDFELAKNPLFGGQIKKDKLFEDDLKLIGAESPDLLAKAQKIFKFIQGRYKWNQFYAKYSQQGIKKAYEQRSGSAADINLSLIAALRSADLPAEPVLISTRDNGLVNKLYPVISEFNYVIARLEIDNQVYLLDATDPLLPFGLLPFRCFNGYGRVISSNKPSYWMDLNASHKEREVFIFDLNLEESGKITGTLSRTSYDYEAYNRRKEIKRFNTLEEYKDNFSQKLSKTIVKDFQILHADSIEGPLTEIYQIEINAFDEPKKNQLFLNPFFLSRIAQNPFKLKDRSYPIDWGVPTDRKMVFSLKLPAHLELIDKPQNLSLVLPENGGQFTLISQFVDNVVQFQQVIRFNKSVYSPDEYFHVQELFNKIIQTHRSDLVLRKKV